MSVNPGLVARSSFIESQVKKICDLRRLCVEKVIEAGANALVAGSAVFGTKYYAEAIRGIKTSKRPEPVAV